MLTALLVYFTYSASEFNKQIQKEKETYLDGQRYWIAQASRDFLLEYLDNAIEFILRESNTVLILGPQFSKRDTIYNYIDFQPTRRSLEAIATLGHSTLVEDEIGVKVKKYFSTKPLLKIDISGLLTDNEMIHYRELQEAIIKCTSELSYIINRLSGSHISTVKLFSKNKTEKLDLRKNPVHLYWLNRARGYIKEVKTKTNNFLSHFQYLNTDTLKFICGVKSPIPFSQREAFQGRPSPRILATLYLDSLNYELDYYKYYIEHMDSTDWPDTLGSTRTYKIN